MGIEFFDKIENESVIDIDCYYHSVHYKNKDYKSILIDGIKCMNL